MRNRDPRHRAHGETGADDAASLLDHVERAVDRACPRWLLDQRDDLVQQTVLRLMKRNRGEGDGPPPSSYTHRAVFSVLVDEIRRRRRRREQPLDDDENAMQHESSNPDPERVSVSRHAGGALRDCLGRLVRPRRLAVVLRLQGHTVPEAARILGWGRKRTENLVYRGMDDLRSCLRAKGVEP